MKTVLEIFFGSELCEQKFSQCMVSTDHTAVVGAYQRAPQRGPPAARTGSATHGSIVDEHGFVTRRTLSCAASCRARCDGTPSCSCWGAATARHEATPDRARRLANTYSPTTDPSVANPVPPEGLPEEPSDKYRPRTSSQNSPS